MKEHRGAFAEQETGVEAACVDILSVLSHEKKAFADFYSNISLIHSVN